MKAIETEYAGCRFRSRLEARWAVVFDHLGVEWQYEPEGFEFKQWCGDGDRHGGDECFCDVPTVRYLPDFWLPEISAYVEVKGSLNPIDVKWRAFHDEVNGSAHWQIVDLAHHPIRENYETPNATRTFLVGPLPTADEMDIESGGGTGDMKLLPFAFGLGPGSPHSGWSFGRCWRCDRYDFAHVAFPTIMSCGHPFDPCDDSVYMGWFPVPAYRAGRQARFEHGETPTRPRHGEIQ